MAPYVEDGPGWDAWRESYGTQYSQPDGYADGLEHFFTEGTTQFLGASQSENTVCSPVNIYMALTMLAECTDGSSRQQILDLMGIASIQELRQQAGYVWNAHYRDDGLAKLLMANFSGITDASVYVDLFDHTARLTIDEDGVTAVAFTVISGDAGSMPPIRGSRLCAGSAIPVCHHQPRWTPSVYRRDKQSLSKQARGTRLGASCNY